MTINLAKLPPHEKQQIEIDKQAAYAVWKVKNGKADPSVFLQEAQAIKNPEEKSHYESCVAKYKAVMGI